MTDGRCGMSSDPEPTNWELIEAALMRLDPETRYYTIQTMLSLQKMPTPVAVRFLLDLPRFFPPPPGSFLRVSAGT